MTDNQLQKDFATGKPVDTSKPEEKVRQDYESILVHDYGYPISHIDIEVPIQMGSSRKRCDIAVYSSHKKEKIVGIVEIKRPKGTGGKRQLDSYMSATPTCKWGVLTNGEETHYATKIKGEIKSAFSIPKYGEEGARVLSYGDLQEASDLKWLFRHINQRLYANTNLPRSEKQGAEMVRLIFCKLSDEYKGEENPSGVPDFQVKEGENKQTLRKRINKLWEETKQGFVGKNIFEKTEKIKIDDYSLELIVSTLQRYSFLRTDRDVVGDAFEIFAERHFAGEKGQFFTPRKVVDMVIKMINPKQNETIIDPACGSGGFLISALNHMTKGASREIKNKHAEHSLYGIDKDSDLVKICKAQMAIIGDGKSNIVEADSLRDPKEWSDTAKSKMQEDGKLKKFDIVITNPPFGSKIKVEEGDVLNSYELGHVWSKQGNEFEKTGETKKTPPQVLFIERCLGFLKDGGRLGIVLPDGLLGNPRDCYIRHYINQNARTLAVVDCPVATFMPHTGTKTSVLILKKKPAKERDIFFCHF